jgi:hypothetical protein
LGVGFFAVSGGMVTESELSSAIVLIVSFEQETNAIRATAQTKRKIFFMTFLFKEKQEPTGPCFSIPFYNESH